MQAALFDAFEAPIRVETVADPVPREDGVVVRVMANGICRSDWHGWKGHDAAITRFPHVPGHEMAGIVESVGKGVGRWRPGDRVTAPFGAGCGRCAECAAGNHQVCPNQSVIGFTRWGSFAERVAIDFADVNLVALPEGMGFVEAAGLGCRFTTAFRAVAQQGRLAGGEWVAVHGCGGVGLSAVMIAVALGGNVVAIDIRRSALERARTAGAAVLIDAGAVEDVAEAVREATGGGAQLSLDALGHPATCRNSILCLRPKGRHVQVGIFAAGHEEPPLPMMPVLARELELLGSHGMAAHAFPGMLAMIEAGRLAPGDLVGEVVSLEEGVRILQAMDDDPPVGVSVVAFGQ